MMGHMVTFIGIFRGPPPKAWLQLEEGKWGKSTSFSNNLVYSGMPDSALVV